MKLRPIFLLAYANTVQAESHLSALSQERKGIRDALLQSPHCQASEISGAYLTDIEDSFKKYGQDIVAFHFAGHGGSEELEMVGANGKLSSTFIQGLAAYIALHGQPRMVFLNACATKDQAQVFHQHGVDIVIATHEPIKDAVAKDFATLFYQNLAGVRSVKQAFQEANLQLRSRHQLQEVYRDRVAANNITNASEPYLLSIRSGKPDAANATLQQWQEEFSDKPEDPIGKHAYLLCDRNKAVKGFRDTLSLEIGKQERQPYAFLIHGSSRELLQSLNERLRRFTSRQVLDPGEQNNSFLARLWDIELPDGEDFKHPDERIPLLRRNQALSHAFKLRGNDISASMVLSRINRNQEMDVAFLCHYLLAENWHPKMKDFLINYINDFTQLSTETASTQLILTFNIIYPLQKGLLGRFRSPEGKVSSALQAIAQQAHNCSLLERLQDVPHGDVYKWQAKQKLQDAPFTDRVFGKKKKLPMQDIEPELVAAIERHNKRML